MMFIAEYSPLPGTCRSNDVRVEFDEPCTMNRIGSGFSPGYGAPTRLRQRLSFTLPFCAQYSWLQISASPAEAVVTAWACADDTPATRPAPTAPALMRTVRRAMSCS